MHEKVSFGLVNNALIPPQFGPDMNMIGAEFDTIAQ
jgi:hypothetical protein